MTSEALKIIRDFHDLTQQQLADKLDISRSYLSELESGKKTPTLELIEKYSSVFNLPKSSLFYFIEALESNDLNPNLESKVASGILKIMKWVSIKKDVLDGK